MQVSAGAPLVMLEAMKMEHAVVAPCAGVVSGLSVVTGGQVTQGQLLARVTPTTAVEPAAAAATTAAAAATN